MMNRDLIVVAVTTTGRDPLVHSIVDVAAVNTRTGQSWQIARRLTAAEVESSDTDTLNSFGYTRESLLERAAIADEVVAEQLADLAAGLRGNTVGGAYPQFSAAFLDRLLTTSGYSAAWHYRLAEIGALTAGAFGMEPTTIPKLSVCCRLWGIPLGDLNTAWGSAYAAAQCFDRLSEYAGSTPPPHPEAGRSSQLMVVPELSDGEK